MTAEGSATRRRLAPISVWVLGLAVLALVASGCATPVGVKPVDVQTGYRLMTENALSVGKPSEASKTVLRRLGLMDRFDKEPGTVLAELHGGLGSAGDDERLFALSELSFLHAERTGDRTYYLASAVYAWALLFPGDAPGARLQPSDPRLRLTYDLYNQAVAQGLTAPRGEGNKRGGNLTETSGKRGEVRLEPGVHRLPFGSLQITLDESELTWGGYRLEHFVPTTTLEVRGLRNRYRDPGLGASLAASMAPGQAATKVVGAERIGALTKVAVTALLRFETARASLSSGQVRGRLEVYAADQADTVTVDGQTQPLESDTTAALAYTLDKSPLYSLEIAAFLRGGTFARSLPRDRAQDGLFMLQPYRPGQIPVVLVHGTASSPARWAELANELEGDPLIRQRFTIWPFFYDTGNPIAYSAGRLRAALTATVKELDPEGKDPALCRMVVIGHSQGGLLTKLTAIDSGTKFWDRLSSKPFEAIEVSPETRALLQQSLFFTPLPFVECVVFISTPHHGAIQASGGLGAIASWLVSLPGTVLGGITEVSTAAAATGDEKLVKALRRPPTAIDNMNPRNPFLLLLESMPVDPRIQAYSIIAVKGDGPKEEGDDGVVTYQSAHIDGVVSELVVRWGHSSQGQPEVIEEIRRILLELAASPGKGGE